MIDERKIYDFVTRLPAEQIKMYPGWPETFNEITPTKSVGSWKLDDNSVVGTTSTNNEYLTRVRIQINTWSKTPEQRNDLNLAINQIFNVVFRRQAVTNLEETIAGGIKTYRSILIFSGIVDTRSFNVSRI